MTQQDFQINHIDNSYYTISKMKRLFWFIHTWEELTYAETENTDDEIIKFKTLNDAKHFINYLVNSKTLPTFVP